MDNSESYMNDSSIDPDEQPKPITFTFEDRDLILGLYSVEPEIEGTLRLAAVKGKGIVVRFNAGDLEQLLGEIAAVANHETDRKLKKRLDSLFGRVSDMLEREFPQ
jgi:hypothetical protein